MTEFVSGIYKGKVNHRRLSPKRHSFTYSYAMWLIDVDELPLLTERFSLIGSSRFSPISIRLSDHLENIADPDSFKSRIREKVKQLGGQWQGSKVLIMTQARMFGLYFSPVNFHFCYEGDTCRFMLAEVSNTPWQEKHWYLVDLEDAKTEKDFHVSPFMPIEQIYRWRIKLPGQHFLAHIENWQQEKVFDATLRLDRLTINRRNLYRMLLRFPITALTTVAAIYWQAAKMFIKGFKFYSYQKSRGHDGTSSSG